MNPSRRFRFGLLALAAFLGGLFVSSAAAGEPAEDPEAAVGRLLPRLSSDSFPEREKATAELLALGERALPAIRKALEKAEDPEVQTRLRGVFEKLEPERIRALEARITKEREIDFAFYLEIRISLLGERKDQWVVLAGGKMVCAAERFEKALALAGEKTAGAAHRFVFQAGHEPPLKEDPRGHGSLRAGDFGCAFGGKSISIAVVDGKPCFVGPDGKMRPVPPIRFSPPSGDVPEASFEPFFNTGMPGEFCIDPDTARDLGLARFEIPGVIEGATLEPFGRPGVPLDYPARRAWVHVRMRGVADEPDLVQAVIPTKVEKK
jgi:hypothetical protein